MLNEGSYLPKEGIPCRGRGQWILQNKACGAEQAAERAKHAVGRAAQEAGGAAHPRNIKQAAEETTGEFLIRWPCPLLHCFVCAGNCDCSNC